MSMIHDRPNGQHHGDEPPESDPWASVGDDMLDAAPRFEGPPISNELEPDCLDPACLTDVASGARFAADHGAIVRHSHPWGKWLVWDSTRWRIDDTGMAMALAKRTITGLYRWARAQIKLLESDTSGAAKSRATKIKAVLDHAIKSQHVSRVKAMVELARSEPGIPVLPDALDRDPWALNCANGTLNLRTGELRPHNQADHTTKLCPVRFDPSAQCPLWERSVARWMDANQSLIDFLSRAVGYSLTGSCDEQCLFFLHGDGQNGKSTFLGVLQRILGDYAIQAVPELLTTKNNEAHPTERADLFGVRFAATIETEHGKRMAEALVKQLTGGDKIRGRKMRQDFFEFEPTHKIWFAANHKPRIVGTDFAIWRRIRLVPFAAIIPEADKDEQLKDKLIAESSGILNWALRGCLEWQRDGLRVPNEVKAAVEEYRADQDKVRQFLGECCELNREFRCKKSELYQAFKEWSESNGDRPLNATAFGLGIARHGITTDSGKRWYLGVALRPEAD